jgi:hypothetical protein
VEKIFWDPPHAAPSGSQKIFSTEAHREDLEYEDALEPE